MDYDCSVCKNEHTVKCDECSVLDMDNCCSCHINPPCGYCTDNCFEDKRRWDDKAIDEGKIKS